MSEPDKFTDMLGLMADHAECAEDRQALYALKEQIEGDGSDFMCTSALWASFWIWWTGGEE